MFGFRGGENAEIVTRKRAYMREAQRLWPFLTNFDVSTIRNEQQLVEMVKDRSARPRDAARAEVASWADGKQF